MGGVTRQPSAQRAWAIARRQHGVIATHQLLELGYTSRAIEHRVSKGRLHRVHRGVYAVGRRELSQDGRFMAAVLACGPGAVLSHESAAVLWGIRRSWPGRIQISVPTPGGRRRNGITVHRRRLLTGRDVTRRRGIPVTDIVCTIVDLTSELRINQVERVINEADQLELIDPETLRTALEDTRRRPGVAKLRELLDRRTFRLTRSELERLFLVIVRRAGLPLPLTRQIVNGFEVDFYWPELGLVVETDGLRYHRTPQQQERGLVRDQVHVEAVLVAGAVRAASP